MLKDSIEKYKKVSFFKNDFERETQNLYYSTNGSSGSKSDRSTNVKPQKQSATPTPQNNFTKMINLHRERYSDKAINIEKQLNDTSTTLTNANHNDSSQNLEKFKKINKFLLFRSRDRSDHSSHRETRGISFSIGNALKNDLDKDKTNPFITHSIQSPRSKQNLDQSSLTNTKKYSLALDKIDNSQHLNGIQKFLKQATPISPTQEKQIIQRDPFRLKLNLTKSPVHVQSSQLNENQAGQNNPITPRAYNNENNKQDSTFTKKDSVIEDLPNLPYPKQTSLQKMISRIHNQSTHEKSPKRSSIDSSNHHPSDHSPSSPGKSPLSKKLDLINQKFSQMESPYQTRKQQSTHEVRKDEQILIRNIMDSQNVNEKKRLTMRSAAFNKRQQVQNNQYAKHSFSQANGSASARNRNGSNSPLKAPQINNLVHYSRNAANQSHSATPIIFDHHFNKKIQRQLRQNRSQHQQEEALTSSHILIKTQEQEQKSPLKNQSRLYSKTPAERNIQNQTSIRVIEPPNLASQQTIQTSQNKTSFFFSNYVALTFRNNLLELRKRAQMQIIQKLSFESRQALKRLVIYINDMQTEYVNIKKVSQVIYQLIYHIPYLVNMLYQNDKILLRERIDYNYVCLFLTNRTNMNYTESKGESYEQMLDNKIQTDIIFLNEKLTEFIKKKFQDRFQLISQNIIDEHDKVYNLEQQIEEKIAKAQRQVPNPNKKFLKQKHNYSPEQGYMFHTKNKNQNTFAQTFYNETKRLGEFNCIDMQNVAISHELDNLYYKVQNQTSNKNEVDPFEVFDKQKLQESEQHL